ncbi:MAG TPA: CPBP family intramembrane glutamic endopeptidase [Pyrinomonadaceae bacterium]
MEITESTENFVPPPPEDISNAALPTPNNPPWNGWTAFGVWFASIVFIIVLPNLFLTPYLLSKNIDSSDQTAFYEFLMTDPTAVILRLASVIPAHLFTLFIAWLVVTRFNAFSFRQTLGWGLDKFKIWHGIVLFILFYGLGLALIQIFGDVETEFDKLLKSSGAAVFLIAFFATFTAPLVEEVVYRGLLYSAFQRRFGVTLAVVLVTILFTVVHIPQYSSGSVPDYATVIMLLLLSLTLTMIRVRTNNLLPCIIFHTIVNGIQSIFLLLKLWLESVEPTSGTSGFFLYFFQ